MNNRISSIKDVDSWMFKNIYKQMALYSIANVSFNENEEANYYTLLKNISEAIQIPLNHIDVALLAQKDLLMIWKFIELVVGFREGYFNSKKLCELKKCEEDVVKMANDVLELFNIPRCISNIYEVNDEFFIRILEIILGHKVKGLVRPTSNDEERIKNIDCILSILAKKFIRCPLNHVSSFGVVSGNFTDIKFLLEVIRDLIQCKGKYKNRGKKECRFAADEDDESEDSCGRFRDKMFFDDASNCVMLPTMEEVVVRCGIKEKGRMNLCREEGKKNNEEGDCSKESGKPPKDLFEIICARGEDDEDSDAGAIARLRKSIKDVNLDEFSEDVCEQYKEAVDRNVNRELQKTKDLHEKLCGMNACETCDVSPPSDIKRLMYWRSMLKSFNRDPDLDSVCCLENKCSNKCLSQNQNASCVAGKVMAYLLEEYPSIEIPDDMKNKLCKANHQKETIDARLLQELKRSQCDKVSEAVYRQNQSLELMKREFEVRERLRNLRDKRCQQMRARALVRNRKVLTNRVRKKCEEIEANHCAKEAKKKSSTIQAFRQCNKKRLNLEKEIMICERMRQREKRIEEAKMQVEELQSIENYYRDQFAIMREKMRSGNAAECLRNKAQEKLLREMKFEMRKNLEEEFQQLQNKLLKCNQGNKKKMLC